MEWHHTAIFFTIKCYPEDSIFHTLIGVSYLDVLKHLRDEMWCKWPYHGYQILGLFIPKCTNSLGVLHYRNLDHDNIPWLANTLFIGFNTQWLDLFPKLNSKNCVRDPLKLQHVNRPAESYKSTMTSGNTAENTWFN